LTALALQGKSATMAKMHKSLVKPKGPRKRTLNFKVPDSEAREIKAIANKYTRGNVTALARLAIKHFRPKKSELVPVRASTR
jgi:hypothetical protein